MYSMAAFGPVIGFLLGAYLLSFHMDWFSSTVINIGEFCRQVYFRNPDLMNFRGSFQIRPTGALWGFGGAGSPFAVFC